MTDATVRGRTVLVTGSVQGIGLAIATAMGRAGARVAIHGLASPAEAEAAVEQVRSAGAQDAKFFAGDLRKPDEIEQLIGRVRDWGPIDILVNNAGVQHPASLATVDPAVWDLIISVNLSAAFHTMRLVLPDMAARGFGRVINIASVHGLVASKDKGPYVASKFGLVGLSRVAALEYAAAGSAKTGGVTVNCICPGFTETPILGPQIAARANAAGVDPADAIQSLLDEKHPSRRLSHPDEIAAVCLWLCQPVAHNMTGVALPIDGGWTVQ